MGLRAKFLFLILLGCFSCEKKSETGVQNKSQYYAVGGRVVCDSETMGAYSVFDVVRLGGGEQKSVWMSVTTNSGQFIQSGYTMIGGIIPATMVFNNGNPGFIDPIFFNTTNLIEGQKNKFAVYWHSEGRWRLAINDIPIVEFSDTATSVRVATVSIECASAPKPAQFPTINAYPAIMLLKNNQWVTPITAESWGLANSYGVEGKNQNPKLKVNEINMGSKIKQKPVQVLW